MTLVKIISRQEWFGGAQHWGRLYLYSVVVLLTLMLLVANVTHAK